MDLGYSGVDGAKWKRDMMLLVAVQLRYVSTYSTYLIRYFIIDSWMPLNADLVDLCAVVDLDLLAIIMRSRSAA